MYILDINFFKKQSKIYLIISIYVLIFSIIYEMFSNGVYSLHMICAFLVPLIFGTFFSNLIYKNKIKKIPNRISINLYNASIATFTVYMIIYGVLDIYGTTNKLINIYLLAGIVLLVFSFFTRNINKK